MHRPKPDDRALGVHAIVPRCLEAKFCTAPELANRVIEIAAIGFMVWDGRLQLYFNTTADQKGELCARNHATDQHI